MGWDGTALCFDFPVGYLLRIPCALSKGDLVGIVRFNVAVNFGDALLLLPLWDIRQDRTA